MSIMNKEQISILTAPFLHHTFAYGLDSIEANGFRSIELWGASPHFCLDDDTPEGHTARIREINQMLKDRGLKMTVFHPEQCRQYPINIASPIPYVRNYSINMMKQYLEDTAAFETDKMMLHPGWEYVDSPSEDNFLRLVESVQILSEKAEELGIVMVMEEMSELQKELCKHARGKDNQLSIAEEIADVLIMLDQMMILHDCESIVAQYKQEKLERLEERLKQ